MKIYFAGPWSYGPKLKDLRNVIQSRWPSIKITSTWLNIETSVRSANMLEAGQYAQQDLDDILRADHLVLFNPPGAAQTPGRNIEFGFALACGLGLCVVGERRGVFQYLPQVRNFSSEAGLVNWLESMHQSPYAG